MTDEDARIARLETTVAVHAATLARIETRLDLMLIEAKKDRHDLAGRMMAALGEQRDDFEKAVDRLDAHFGTGIERLRGQWLKVAGTAFVMSLGVNGLLVMKVLGWI